jgi:branched-chain amino acid transport system ATP-binding protein
MLSVSNLHVFYGASHVLHGVSLPVEQGSVTAVLGRNGAGKTTLCGALVGFNPARSGHVIFAGTNVTHLPAHRIHRLGLALVPQGRRIFPSLSVEENLRIAAGSPDLSSVLGVFPRLRERITHRGGALSGGEQQMLAIARALVSAPRLLVMDEPTEGLAPALVRDVANLIGRLRAEGTTVLLVEQNAAFAVRVADYVHVMSKGAIVHSSDPGVLWNDERIRTELLGVPGR